jgi:tetratricopeptide (TPR) repeat protein
MASPSTSESALALVHQGWDHLRRQRPLAAWASWQQALRLSPGNPAAQQALDLLASADDLPAAARAEYRFRPPLGDDRRARWDHRLRGGGLDDLDEAASAFSELAKADPTDSAARYNEALCLAWRGANRDAIGALEHVVTLDAASAFESAVAAWALAEVLRHGAGAEDLADDMDQAITLPRDGGRWGAESLAAPDCLRALAISTGPAGAPLAGTRVYEWLDRPMPAASELLTSAELPTVVATVVETDDSLRLSTPRPGGLAMIATALSRLPDAPADLPDAELTPLPHRLLDAAVWTFRLPTGLDDSTRSRLSREAVEDYYENRWIHVPRLGLGSGDDALSPLKSSRLAEAGDLVARAKLAAVVAVREQLGARRRTAGLYAGYPFDRLRRRLGLEPSDPSSVEPNDFSCMGLAELGRLDPSGLDANARHEAYRSAAALGDAGLTARMKTWLADEPGETT